MIAKFVTLLLGFLFAFGGTTLILLLVDLGPNRLLQKWREPPPQLDPFTSFFEKKNSPIKGESHLHYVRLSVPPQWGHCQAHTPEPLLEQSHSDSDQPSDLDEHSFVRLNPFQSAEKAILAPGIEVTITQGGCKEELVRFEFLIKDPKVPLTLSRFWLQKTADLLKRLPYLQNPPSTLWKTLQKHATLSASHPLALGQAIPIQGSRDFLRLALEAKSPGYVHISLLRDQDLESESEQTRTK